VAFGLRLRKTPKTDIERRGRETARTLGIEELLRRKPGQLSGGQRQRVALGRAIVREPAAFLLDEPLSNLDAKLRMQTRAELSKLHQRLETTFIYVTHDQVEAMTMATRIAVMNEGILQQVGTPQELYDRPDNMFVAGFIGSPAMNFFEATVRGNQSEMYLDMDSFHVAVPPQKANGLTVIIDVFRAFTTAAYAFNNGAKKIIPVGKLEDAFKLKKENPDFVLMGERNGIKPKGFDYGNSPFQIENVDFTGKTIIITTSSGTQGVVNAKDANEIILGNFVNIQEIINHIKRKNPEIVTLVAMGDSGIKIADEDELCGQYIKKSLEGKTMDFDEIKDYLKNYKGSQKFFDKNDPHHLEEDFYCALDINKFNFIMKIIEEDEKLVAVKEEFK